MLADIETLLAEAVAIPGEEDRNCFLDQACGERAELRREVERMVQLHLEAGTFLEQALLLADTLPTPDAPLNQVGTDIGPYRLLEQIGEGGMDIVYMAAQQKPLRRNVALKVIKPGMDSREVIARFEAERQALAMMDHPNISRVIDGGTTESGRPYFVMELVSGIPITKYCDEERLATEDRLKLFIEICHAVQHAHQKGIIHRDLKPSNVMVTMHDDIAVVKVIDFGVAKALHQQLTDTTLFTGYQQMLGTPLYMSPEQAQMSGIDIDTRSDVYSLGVMLYELLTGTTPFDKAILRSASFDDVRRIILEEEPPRPSARISTLNAQALATIADRRRIDQRRVSDELRGELDWIVMKALEKNRIRRYESASALAQDVQRYLEDEPVIAYPPSTFYWLRKVGGLESGRSSAVFRCRIF